VNWEPPEQLGVGCWQVTPQARRYVNQVLDSGRLSYGPVSREFETRFAAAHGRRHGVLSNSGTSALHVALAALAEKHGWEPGDEVIVPAVTFVASANTILQAGLRPVFADVDPLTYNLDPAAADAAVTGRTRAVMPVHLCGLPADMAAVMKIAAARGLRVVEDACETGFVSAGGQPVGSHGDVACFSTYVAHLIVTGVGGLSLTDDPELATVMRSLCNHGRDPVYLSIDDDETASLDEVVSRRFWFTRHGFSYRVTEMEAALGLAALETRDAMLAARQVNAAALSAGLAGLAAAGVLQLPRIPPGAEHAFMMYPLVVTADGVRDDLMLYLEKRGIETRMLTPLISQPVYAGRADVLAGDFPVARYLNGHAFYIGCHQGLGEREISYMCGTIRSYFGDGGSS